MVRYKFGRRPSHAFALTLFVWNVRSGRCDDGSYDSDVETDDGVSSDDDAGMMCIYHYEDHKAARRRELQGRAAQPVGRLSRAQVRLARALAAAEGADVAAAAAATLEHAAAVGAPRSPRTTAAIKASLVVLANVQGGGDVSGSKEIASLLRFEASQLSRSDVAPNERQSARKMVHRAIGGARALIQRLQAGACDGDIAQALAVVLDIPKSEKFIRVKRGEHKWASEDEIDATINDEADRMHGHVMRGDYDWDSTDSDEEDFEEDFRQSVDENNEVRLACLQAILALLKATKERNSPTFFSGSDALVFAAYAFDHAVPKRLNDVARKVLHALPEPMSWVHCDLRRGNGTIRGAYGTNEPTCFDSAREEILDFFQTHIKADGGPTAAASAGVVRWLVNAIAADQTSKRGHLATNHLPSRKGDIYERVDAMAPLGESFVNELFMLLRQIIEKCDDGSLEESLVSCLNLPDVLLTETNPVLRAVRKYAAEEYSGDEIEVSSSQFVVSPFERLSFRRQRACFFSIRLDAALSAIAVLARRALKDSDAALDVLKFLRKRLEDIILLKWNKRLIPAKAYYAFCVSWSVLFKVSSAHIQSVRSPKKCFLNLAPHTFVTGRISIAAAQGVLCGIYCLLLIASTISAQPSMSI